MKRILSKLLIALSITNLIIPLEAGAQLPEKMSYQGVIRNSEDKLVTNHEVGMQISILKDSVNGKAVYTETQISTTNTNGLISIEIGSGTIVSGTFSTIDWAVGPYFIKIETDPSGGTSYTISGTSQLLSVPYALYAKKSGNAFSGKYADLIDKPSIPDTLKDLKLDAGNQIIGNVSNPVNVQDAATKTYVDAVTAQIKNIENMLIDNKEFFITDVIGNHYKTVRIGSQVWMAENLKTTKFNDGSALAYPGTDNSAWLHDTTGAYAWYNNTESNKNPYGALYNWYAVKSDNLCPTGWHLPTKDEWTTLIEYMGGQSLAGGKLKETGTAHWASPNTGATNEVDFTALPGGERLNDGTFSYINAFGYYWSSTEYSSLYARYYYMYYYSGYASNSYNYKNFGYSVRCVKD